MHFFFLQKIKEVDKTGKKALHTLTPPQQWNQKVMAFSITTRMLRLPRVSSLIINLGLKQT